MIYKIKQNPVLLDIIYSTYGGVDQYTGYKISRNNASIDHIIPSLSPGVLREMIYKQVCLVKQGVIKDIADKLEALGGIEYLLSINGDYLYNYTLSSLKSNRIKGPSILGLSELVRLLYLARDNAPGIMKKYRSLVPRRTKKEFGEGRTLFFEFNSSFMKKNNLSLNDYLVCLYIDNNQGRVLPISEISNTLHLSHKTVSRSIKRIVNKGLVSKRIVNSREKGLIFTV